MKHILLTIFSLGIIGANIFFISGSLKSHDVVAEATPAPYATGPSFNNAQAYVLPLSGPSYIPILDSNVPRPTLDAKSAIVFNLRSSRYLYQDNIREKLPIASLTKILSATVVIERMNLEDVVTVSKSAVKADGEKQDLYTDEKITVGNLLRMMLISSSNDAAYALADYAKTQGFDFVAAMNEKAQALSMNDSQFLDPAGLNDDAYSTVYDLIKLVRATLKYDQIWNTLIEKESEVTSVDGKIKHPVKNTDQLLGIIPNIIGGKTGNTDGALGCLILLVNIPEYNDTLISIVLGSHDRFGDTQKMVEWVKSAYRWQ